MRRPRLRLSVTKMPPPAISPAQSRRPCSWLADDRRAGITGEPCEPALDSPRCKLGPLKCDAGIGARAPCSPTPRPRPMVRLMTAKAYLTYEPAQPVDPALTMIEVDGPEQATVIAATGRAYLRDLAHGCAAGPCRPVQFCRTQRTRWPRLDACIQDGRGPSRRVTLDACACGFEPFAVESRTDWRWWMARPILAVNGPDFQPHPMRAGAVAIDAARWTRSRQTARSLAMWPATRQAAQTRAGLAGQCHRRPVDLMRRVRYVRARQGDGARESRRSYEYSRTPRLAIHAHRCRCSQRCGWQGLDVDRTTG